MIDKIKNLFRKKDKITGKKLPLIHVYTFKNGTNLYTYRVDDYGKISARYWKAINEQLNYLTMFNVDKNTAQAAIELVQQKCNEICNGNDVTNNAMQIFSLMEHQKSIPMRKTAVQLKMHEVLFCMFFLIDEEIEGGFNEAMNTKKIELLFSEPNASDNFFFQVNEILNSLDIRLSIDIPAMIAQIATIQRI